MEASDAAQVGVRAAHSDGEQVLPAQAQSAAPGAAQAPAVRRYRTFEEHMADFRVDASAVYQAGKDATGRQTYGCSVCRALAQASGGKLRIAPHPSIKKIISHWRNLHSQDSLRAREAERAKLGTEPSAGSYETEVRKGRRVYLCKRCGKACCHGLADVFRHLHEKHPEAFEHAAEVTPPLQAKTWKCDLCTYTATEQFKLKRHASVHSLGDIRNPCAACGQTYTSKTAVSCIKRAWFHHKKRCPGPTSRPADAVPPPADGARAPVEQEAVREDPDNYDAANPQSPSSVDNDNQVPPGSGRDIAVDELKQEAAELLRREVESEGPPIARQPRLRGLGRSANPAISINGLLRVRDFELAIINVEGNGQLYVPSQCPTALAMAAANVADASEPCGISRNGWEVRIGTAFDEGGPCVLRYPRFACDTHFPLHREVLYECQLLPLCKVLQLMSKSPKFLAMRVRLPRSCGLAAWACLRAGAREMSSASAEEQAAVLPGNGASGSSALAPDRAPQALVARLPVDGKDEDAEHAAAPERQEELLRDSRPVDLTQEPDEDEDEVQHEDDEAEDERDGQRMLSALTPSRGDGRARRQPEAGSESHEDVRMLRAQQHLLEREDAEAVGDAEEDEADEDAEGDEDGNVNERDEQDVGDDIVIEVEDAMVPEESPPAAPAGERAGAGEVLLFFRPADAADRTQLCHFTYFSEHVRDSKRLCFCTAWRARVYRGRSPALMRRPWTQGFLAQPARRMTLSGLPQSPQAGAASSSRASFTSAFALPWRRT